MGSIIAAVIGAATTIISGAVQASATSQANAAQKEMYEKSVAYQEQQDKQAAAHWRAEFGLRREALDENKAAARYQRAQGERAYKQQSIQNIGDTLRRLSTEDPAATGMLWNMWSGARRAR